MYGLKLQNVDNTNPYEELIKLFLTPQQYRIFSHEEESVPAETAVFSFEGDKDRLKRELYGYLAHKTGLRPKWGILTGIRPVKLAGELQRKLGSAEKAKQMLIEDYLVEEGKADLLLELYAYQQRYLGKPGPDSAGIYIGIPFCPTRCLYCSFTSNQAGPEEIERYLKALHKEIAFVGQGMAADGITAESLYIGGGTPTTLTAEQLAELLACVRNSMDLSRLAELTVEAGRPDTITPEKLEVLKAAGVNRISINPQTMHDTTLELIGRSHTKEQTLQAFQMAREAGIDRINADLIAGLPGETAENFQESLAQVIELGAENITLHTLAVKRSSRLKEMDENFHYRQPQLAETMLSQAAEKLRNNGYRPYYLYRQKHTAGSTENIGYCREDALSVYNVRIMEEAQSIIALGAGGITKVYYPRENRLERVPNVSNYEIYIERIEEMLDRKKKNLFRR
ncbi:coproporphyrinogen dehydrogenase HemZ [Anaerovorax odorimutans]|uniref:Coproporphyrinogen dehydrogenase HemZ n=1 Tax=Anaerovorax odorimutans TaxID=109327 RepID=A0ABT1RL47_9FIRM|nr:coproporphyrinogen dehydrogenase HemZ [Anaerovorax odorimutans]MCQ4635911.1 coproporphyrinogen dehydrogenase HemZ [Anaerovorax odorimutans]